MVGGYNKVKINMKILFFFFIFVEMVMVFQQILWLFIVFCFCVVENKENVCFFDIVIEMLNLKWLVKILLLVLWFVLFIIISSFKVINVLKFVIFCDK